MTDPNPYPKVDYGRNINSPDVLIIGAGISGICTAIDLIRSGRGSSFVIIEKGNQAVGGTWNDNIYPGCCCDVLSHLYSFSFEPNPDWTREYPGQEEIQDYLIGIAHKYQLYRHIRFNSSVQEARWDDVKQRWQTDVRRLGGSEAEHGDVYSLHSHFLVSAVGQLSTPKYPSLKGLESFRGRTMHSARWDWSYDLRGKKIGIIGTGATAAQIIPEVRRVCKKLVVFQRTPAWVMPRHDAEIGRIRREIYKYIPWIRKRYRARLMDFRESTFDAAFDPQSSKHQLVSSISRQHMLRQLPTPCAAPLREKLTPHYPFSCKRILVSDDYYPALSQENVTLETTSIEQVTPTGVRMKDGTVHDLDVLILATGFRTSDFLFPIKVYGTDGYRLEDAWAEGASAYLGITVPGLPNFGMLYGPNTNLAYNSLILQIEAQSLYINTLISAVLGAKRSGRTLQLQPKTRVFEAYNEEVQARLSRSTFADPNCTSWFKDQHGRITTNWCGSAIQYQERTSFVDWADFDISGTAAEEYEHAPPTRWKRVVEETQISDTMAVLYGFGALGLCAAAFYASRFLLYRL
ncbi:MAG: hypothetical protein LQ338_002469 [Usnochroma carphineum]|nr:MAG: hypothetical protein LQ338_002469 [Usnochroma carphineum]